MTDYKKFIFDLFFPIICLGCGQKGNFICPACLSQIPLHQKIYHEPNSALNKLIVASDYENPLVKQAVHRYKYDFIKALAKPLAELMAKRLTLAGLPQGFASGPDLILIPVPLHKKRLRWRGFNQAELLAEEIGQKLNIPLNSNLLIRVKYSLPQVNLKTPAQRKANIKNSFQIVRPIIQPTKQIIQPAKLENKIIVLVDDVATTGATLEECALALKPLKLKQIWGLVMARG